MKTIEERAKEYAGTPLPTSKVRELRVIDYTKGATEQKQIDIKKACVNFCVACPTYENCDARYNCPIYDKFEKAMEE